MKAFFQGVKEHHTFQGFFGLAGRKIHPGAASVEPGVDSHDNTARTRHARALADEHLIFGETRFEKLIHGAGDIDSLCLT